MRTPQFTYELIDDTFKPELPSIEVVEPLFLLATSADKGPEDFKVVTEKEFFKTYIADKNTIFMKHGQPLLQAANIVTNGGKLLIKRIVADDAKLANISVLGKVVKEEKQKTDKDGNLLYIDKTTSAETIESLDNTPIMISTCKVTYEFMSVEGKDNIKDIFHNIEDTYENIENVFHLFTITDIGRGKSLKKFRISPNTNESRSRNYMKYNFNIMENKSILESIDFTLDSNIIESGVNRSLDNMVNSNSSQLQVKSNEFKLEGFINKVAEISGNDIEYCKTNDLFFGLERKGTVKMKNITVDLSDESNLSYNYGIELKEGSNGEFGESPLKSELYTKKLVEVFTGVNSIDIFDLDKYKIDLVVDCNYPIEVKRAIESLLEFRGDAWYIRDGNLAVRNVEDAIVSDMESLKSKYSGAYPIYYDIKDPYTKKQITVTIGYTLSRLLIGHFKFGRNRPLAGELNSMVISDAIPGTVNFIPAITPAYNQKNMLTENRINFVSYYGDKLVLESMFTSQEAYTDLSFANNVIAIQEVVKDLRIQCPKSRYSFMDGSDLQEYKKDVDKVLSRHLHKFSRLKFIYMEDETMIANKVFYAVIEVVFREFTQAEHFKIYALNE